MKTLCVTGLMVMFVATVAQANGPTIQRYVSTWDAEPQARLILEEAHEANSTRSRLQFGEESFGRWIVGTMVKADGNQVVWNLPVHEYTPGTHAVQHDLRTPLGAVRWSDSLRVPYVARWTGEPIDPEQGVADWPQTRHGVGFQEKHPYWLAWDLDYLYLVGNKNILSKVLIDPLPYQSGHESLEFVAERGANFLAIPWDHLAPAGPFRSQVIRIEFTPDTQWYDVILLGSGLPIHFGATLVSGSPGHDDQGPPREVLRSLYDRIPGFTLRSAGISWGAAEPEDPGTEPSQYDFSYLDNQLNLYYPGMVYIGVDSWNEWGEELKLTDRQRYDELASRFMDAVAKHLRDKGITHFSCGWNEPELFHFPYREKQFVDDLNLAVEPLHREIPEAQIIAGKFSGGNAHMIRSFAMEGFRDNFDILDVHPYSNDPRTGCHMGGVVESYQTLEELGMGHKRIFLGEGWGPTRNLHQVARTKHDQPVSPEEADVMRQFYWNGFRCLTTPRQDFNPEWVFGAAFFTMNDNVGGTYWQVNARPHYNALGEIEYCLLSHLAFPCDGLNPFFNNGGLVDFYGNPKGDWLFDFPPSFPDVRMTATMETDHAVIGAPFPVHLRLVNAEMEPLKDLSIAVRPRHEAFEQHMNGVIVSNMPEGLSHTLPNLAPGEVWETTVLVNFVSTIPATIRVAFEIDYFWQGTLYTDDDVLPIEVREPIEAFFASNEIIFTTDSETAQLNMTMRNNSDQPATPVFQQFPEGVTVTIDPLEPVEPGQSRDYMLTVTGENLPAGMYPIIGDWGTPAGFVIKRALVARRLQTPVTIDADLSDWPEAPGLGDAIVMGGEMEYDSLPMQVPFPIPPQVQDTMGADIESAVADQHDEEESEGQVSSARAVLAWDDDYIYVSVVIDDAIHYQPHAGGATWQADSVQVAFSQIEQHGTSVSQSDIGYLRYFHGKGYGPEDFELTMALTPVGPQVAATRMPSRHWQQDLVVEEADLAVVYTEEHAIYECRIPRSLLDNLDGEFGFDILINDSDGEAGRSTLVWADAIGRGKYPERHVPVLMVE